MNSFDLILDFLLISSFIFLKISLYFSFLNISPIFDDFSLNKAFNSSSFASASLKRAN